MSNHSELVGTVSSSIRRATIALVVVTVAAIGVLGAAIAFTGSPSTPPDDAGLPPILDAAGLDAAPSECMDVDDCKRRCAQREAESCLKQAEQLRAQPRATATARKEMRDAYRSACAAGNTTGCTRAALLAGLQDDYELAPEWIDATRAPLAQLDASCAATPSDELACAALILLGQRSGDPARAASDLIVRCTERRDAESCFLATGARLGGGAPIATTTAAKQQLATLCGAGDLPACMYGGATGDRLMLAAACPDVAADAIASACVKRGANYFTTACAFGDCQKVNEQLVSRACEQERLNACAALIFARSKDRKAWEPVFQRYIDRIPARLRPTEVSRITGEEAACYLGYKRACEAAIKTGPDEATRFAPYLERLKNPLVAR